MNHSATHRTANCSDSLSRSLPWPSSVFEGMKSPSVAFPSSAETPDFTLGNPPCKDTECHKRNSRTNCLGRCSRDPEAQYRSVWDWLRSPRSDTGRPRTLVDQPWHPLMDLGQVRDGIAARREAVAILRECAADNPRAVQLALPASRRKPAPASRPARRPRQRRRAHHRPATPRGFRRMGEVHGECGTVTSADACVGSAPESGVAARVAVSGCRVPHRPMVERSTFSVAARS
jgi:hypothetical protein